MSIVEIKIGKSKYKIECELSEKERLINLAKQISKKFDNLSSSIKNADEKTILVILLLMLKAELVEKDNDDLPDENNDKEEFLNNLSTSIENVTDHINNLANKIRDY